MNEGRWGAAGRTSGADDDIEVLVFAVDSLYAVRRKPLDWGAVEVDLPAVQSQ